MTRPSPSTQFTESVVTVTSIEVTMEAAEVTRTALVVLLMDMVLKQQLVIKINVTGLVACH